MRVEDLVQAVSARVAPKRRSQKRRQAWARRGLKRISVAWTISQRNRRMYSESG